jgi:NTE family protein
MQYDLVFEGGGAKGMVFVGAIQEFEAQGHTYDRLVGTSAGSITASLLAGGYNSSRMLDALGEQADGQPVFASFLGVPGPFAEAQVRASMVVDLLGRIDIPMVPDRWEQSASMGIASALLKIDRFCNLFSFVEEGGWYSASKFVEWMTAKLDVAADGRKTGYGAMTLSQFFEATGKELCLIASDTTAQRMLVLSHLTAPACPLVWAVRMSMSIPLVLAGGRMAEGMGAVPRERDDRSYGRRRRNAVKFPHRIARVTAAQCYGRYGPEEDRAGAGVSHRRDSRGPRRSRNGRRQCRRI